MRARILALLLLASLALPAAASGAIAPHDSAAAYRQAPPLEQLQRRQEAWAARRRLGGWLVVGGVALSVVLVGVVRARQRRSRKESARRDQ